MRQQVRKIFAAAVFGFILNSTYAQHDSSIIAPWASDKGYWVVEGNVHTP